MLTAEPHEVRLQRMSTSRLELARLQALLRRQAGLLTTAQADAVGLSRDALVRRTRGRCATWHRVLPRVYASFLHGLTDQQRCRAAVLYAGHGAVITGLAALRLRRFRYLPDDADVDVLLARRCRVESHGFVRVQRTQRLPTSVVIEGIPTAPVPRAVVDACRQLSTYEDVLAVAAEAVQRRATSVHELGNELRAAPRRGTAQLRRVLGTLDMGARSTAEGKALRLFRAAGLSEPLVNHDLVIDGTWVACPDFRWGRLIVEIDSKEWHLLKPGSWEASQRRRRRLQRRGFVVLVVTPRDLDDEPGTVVADVRAAYELLHGTAPAA